MLVVLLENVVARQNFEHSVVRFRLVRFSCEIFSNLKKFYGLYIQPELQRHK